MVPEQVPEVVHQGGAHLFGRPLLQHVGVDVEAPPVIGGDGAETGDLDDNEGEQSGREVRPPGGGPQPGSGHLDGHGGTEGGPGGAGGPHWPNAFS